MAKKSKEITVGSRVYVVIENTNGHKYVEDFMEYTTKSIKDNEITLKSKMIGYGVGGNNPDYTFKKENVFAVKAHAKAIENEAKAHVGDVISIPIRADGTGPRTPGLVVKISGTYVYAIVDMSAPHKYFTHIMPNNHIRFTQSQIGKTARGINIISRGQGKKAK